MNIKDLIPKDQTVSVSKLFESEKATVKVVQILQDAKLAEHITKVPALLICIIGNAVFENEWGIKETLLPGDYVKIEPMVKHWVIGIKASQLLLFK